MHQPRLLIAADATAGLAPEDAEAILALLTRVSRERGISLVFSTTSPSRAERHAQRAVSLQPEHGVRERPQPAPQAHVG